MMVLHILLTILKWIGILLLAVLGLVLLLIAAVLFVPIRYQAKGSRHEQMQAYVCVSWLLHLLHLTVRYEDGKSTVQLRICGIPFRRKKKRNPARTDAPDIADAETAQDELHADAYENAETENVQEVPENADDAPKAEAADASEPKDVQEAPQTNVIAVSDDTEDTQEKKNIFRRISDFFRRVKEVLHGIRTVLRGISDAFLAAKDRVAYVCEKIKRMWAWRQQPDTTEAVAHIGEEVRYVLQKLKPRKCEISLIFGTGDPASTGELLGALGIVYAWTNGCFTVTPDFEEKRLETDFRLKGRIFLYQLLGTALRLWKDENVHTGVDAFRRL